jgi:hypothetical protein
MFPFDDVTSAVNGLYQFFLAIVELVFYFPVKLLTTFIDIIVSELNLLIGFFNLFIRLYDVIVAGMLGMFDGVYFSSIVNWIMIASITVVLAFRIYHFVKDISIVGNKI